MVEATPFSGTEHLVTGWSDDGRRAKVFHNPPDIDESLPGIYFLFAGDDYYPCGGMEDYIGVFQTIGAALERYDRDQEYEWGHIATMQNNNLIIFLKYRRDWIKGDWYVGWKHPKQGDE